MTALLLALALACAAEVRAGDVPLPPPPDEPHLDFTADHFDYDSASAAIHLKGNVRVDESTPAAAGQAPWTLRGEEIWLYPEKRVGRSEGFLLIDDGYSAVYGDRGEFDFENRRGELRHTVSGYGEWSLRAESLRIAGRDRLEYSGVDFTSCARQPKPHYHFHSSRVSVAPKKHLVAYNTFFYLGRVPIFYMPVLYKSLKKRHFLRFKLQPGYDRRNGGYLKTTLLTEHSPFLYSKLFLDYYTAQGFGSGGELHRRRGEDSRGMLYGYRIRENQSTRRERWAVLGDQYQALGSSTAFQGRLQVQSDSDFNNDYARSNALRVTPELINSAAVVYRVPSATARLSYARVDADDGSRDRFVKSQESSPRLDVQSAQLRWGRLPWLNTLAGFADNSFERGRGFQQRSAGVAWEGAQTVTLPRGISLTPKVGYQETYSSRLDQRTSFASTSTVLDALVGRYSVGGTLRAGSPIGVWDLSHAYSRRLKPGSFADDAGALDHGVESNMMTLADVFRPSRQVFVRVFSGYDFRLFRDRDVGFRERVQPIVGEINFTPRPALNFYLRNDYQLQAHNRSFIANAQWGETDGSFIGGGLSHNKALPRSTFANFEFGWTPWAVEGSDPNKPPEAAATAGFKSWRFGGALRSEVLSGGGLGRLESFRLFEKELLIAKAFHDFYGRGLVRFRPGGVREFFVRIDMRLSSLSRERIVKKDWENEWFPERKRAVDDRP